jgi:hypothetical protein
MVLFKFLTKALAALPQKIAIGLLLLKKEGAHF